MKIYTEHTAYRLWDLIHSLPICHHLPERSRIFGIDLPLCCRCTGIYLFIIVGFLVNRFIPLCDIRRTGRLAFFIALSLVTGVEACAEIAFGVDPGNVVRLFTGAASGFAIGALLSAGLSGFGSAGGKKTP
jgi:uncharacterized membrane protein